MAWLKLIKFPKKFTNNLNSDKLSSNQQLNLFKTISELLNNGFSLKESLLFLQTINVNNSNVITNILIDLQKGKKFSDSLKKYINNNLYYQLKIAENNGQLIKCLQEIYLFLHAKRNQTNKLKEVAAYPSFLLVLLIGMIFGIKHFITPQLESFGSINHTNKDYYILILFILIILLMFGYVFYLFRLSYLKRIDKMMKIPFINLIVKNYYSYYLSSNLSFMLQSGMDMKAILTLMLKFQRNSFMYQFGRELKMILEDGQSIATIINKHSFISEQLLILLSSGDQIEQMALKINAYSKICFQNVFKYSTRLINMIQPFMFLIIGVAITLTYINMLMPMYNALKGVYN